MNVAITIVLVIGLCGLVYWVSRLPLYSATKAPNLSQERLAQVHKETEMLRQWQADLKALDTDPNAPAYTYDQIRHHIGLDGLKCKARYSSQNGAPSAYHYGVIQGQHLNCGYWGIPLNGCTDFVFLEEKS